MIADLTRKAMAQVQRFVRTLLKDSVPNQKIAPERIASVVEALTTGRVTHDYPITVAEATEMGLPITVGLGREIYDLMELYPHVSTVSSGQPPIPNTIATPVASFPPAPIAVSRFPTLPRLVAPTFLIHRSR